MSSYTATRVGSFVADKLSIGELKAIRSKNGLDPEDYKQDIDLFVALNKMLDKKSSDWNRLFRNAMRNKYAQPLRPDFYSGKEQDDDQIATIIDKCECKCKAVEHDEVNFPKHYDVFPGLEAIDIIKSVLTTEQFNGFLMGNALKYRLRAGNKDSAITDINKAIWYQKKLRDSK